MLSIYCEGRACNLWEYSLFGLIVTLLVAFLQILGLGKSLQFYADYFKIILPMP